MGGKIDGMCLGAVGGVRCWLRDEDVVWVEREGWDGIWEVVGMYKL